MSYFVFILLSTPADPSLRRYVANGHMCKLWSWFQFLFRMIKPRKVFFMAIDGVAPRAKMNQQRGRRFRSAREAEELIKKAQEKGEELPTEKRFDSNCITPGEETCSLFDVFLYGRRGCSGGCCLIIFFQRQLLTSLFFCLEFACASACSNTRYELICY